MATYYVDLTLTGYGHAGTQGDPLSIDEAFNNTGIGGSSLPGSMIIPYANDVFYIKGSILFPDSTDIGMGTGNIGVGIGTVIASFLPWDAEVNGPWRIGIANTSTNLNIGQGSLISGGVFFAGNVLIGTVGIATGNVTYPSLMVDCALDAAGGTGFIDIANYNISATTPMVFKGCSFRTSIMQINSRTDMTDSLLNVGSYNMYSGNQNGFMNCASTTGIGGSNTVEVNDQTNWSVVSYPDWDATQGAWLSTLVSTGIATPPEPGNSPYTDYTSGLWGGTRTGIGALDFNAPPDSVSYFTSASVNDGTAATSRIHLNTLVAAIQDDSPDSYFDTTSEINRVVVYYNHEAGRQVKRVVHEGPLMSGLVVWSTDARDGTWQKTRIRTMDSDGAEHNLYRAAIGANEDITHSGGAIHLNTL